MVYSAEFFVNVDAVIAGAQQIGLTFSRASSIIESEMFGFVKQLIYDEFELAGRIANSEDGFPEEFQEHLLNNVSKIIPSIFMDMHGLFISFDLEEWLGGYDDLTKAFHQGAQLEGGGQLFGPYTGQALKQDDAEIRHVFWEAIRYGKAKADIGGKHVPVTGTWDDTIQHYLDIWGEKSPQWLFIQFGQEEWQPYIPQIDVLDNIENVIQAAAASYLAGVLASSVAIANTYKTVGLEVGYTGQKSAPRVISGTVEVNGKIYRPGRFVPRGGI